MTSAAEQIRKAKQKVKRESLTSLFEQQIRALRLPAPVKEYRFHVEQHGAAGRKWRADFAWVDLRLLVEIDGGTFSGGRHTRGKGFEADCYKLNAAAEDGWTVLRYTGDMVRSGHAAHRVGCFIKKRQPRYATDTTDIPSLTGKTTP